MPAALLTRDEILERLYETFGRYGYEGASMARIAASTGLGKASLYHHFPGGKREMAQAVLAHVRGWYEINVFRTLEGVTPPRQRIAAMLEAIGRHHDGGNKACLPALLALTEERSVFGTAIRDLFHRMIGAIAQTLCDAGFARDIATRRAAEAALRIQGALVLARAMTDPRIYTAMASELPDQLLTGADRSALWTARGAPRFAAPPPVQAIRGAEPAAAAAAPAGSLTLSS